MEQTVCDAEGEIEDITKLKESPSDSDSVIAIKVSNNISTSTSNNENMETPTFTVNMLNELPSEGSKSFASPQTYSLSTQKLGAKSIGSASDSLLRPAQESSVKMSMLSAPTPVASSVRTANMPKTASLGVPSNAPLLSTASATGNPRNKVALRKGRGLMDWVRLGNTSPDLAGTGGKLLKVTPKQLAKHCTIDDAWMALRGKVYNVTPYFEFHPGGMDELLRGVGKDATELFNEVHKWVNFESMLQKCFVGHLVEESTTSCVPLRGVSRVSNVASSRESKSTSSFLPPPPPTTTKLPPLKQSNEAEEVSTPKMPSYDWYQTADSLTINVYTRWPAITAKHITVYLNQEVLIVDVIVRSYSYRLHLSFLKPVKPDFKVCTAKSASGKVSIVFTKEDDSVRWTKIGRTLSDNESWMLLDNRERVFHQCRVIERTPVTHNSFLLTLQCPEGVYLTVPTGYHTHLRIPHNAMLSRPYTPIPPSLELPHSTAYTPGSTLHYLIKVYPDGAVSTALDELTKDLSDSTVLEVSGAEGTHVLAVSEGELQEGDTVTDVALIAGGTGITPMLSLLLESIELERRVRLVYCNRTEEDIMLREQLEAFAQSHTEYFKLHHVLSEAPSTWRGLRGRVTRDMLDHLLPIADGTRSVFLAVCGPKGFTNEVLQLLGELGYCKEEHHVFEG